MEHLIPFNGFIKNPETLATLFTWFAFPALCMHINIQCCLVSIAYNIFKLLRSQSRKHKGLMQMGAIFYLILILLGIIASGNAQPLVPAVITFGDSTVDVGNNDYLETIFKANFPPYGRDFKNHVPTGRFCNGKLATDITAETLGFTTYAPAYLSPQASGKNLLIGANFASAASGYYDETAYLYHAIPLSQQLQYYKEYQSKLAQIVGPSKANGILTGSLYILSTGASDFVQNYYINPYLNKFHSPDDFANILIGIFNNFVKDLYGLGARRLGVTSLPPLGCLPAAITLFGHGSNGCVTRLNEDAKNFNRKLNYTVASLAKQYPKLKIAVFDIYQPLYDLVTAPEKQGFFEARRGCCGTGTVETTSLLCNQKSVGTCKNATGYVFWDSVHPSEAANQVLADSLIIAGIDLVT
ncbi:GDSL esterase/lipase APG [Rhynchospora pubera]|uniref:GDSL esterase/lipase APG n=1 Tax=Rhynchospora pubera TaxID=906938 RepID=A0AAV8C0C8_9POAL|nr:GDSL esterase/lipase APG [Rhynchospora pubera]KAJ4798104.1 GDSL esterase/lipase APG [Rhynchospora pubera]